MGKSKQSRRSGNRSSGTSSDIANKGKAEFTDRDVEKGSSTDWRTHAFGIALVIFMPLITALVAGSETLIRILDLRYGILGRPVVALSDERNFLILGTMSSGTTQTARELEALGLEVGHEVSDTTMARCRDGTVSHAHVIRYLRQPSARRITEKLCTKPRFSSFSSAMFDPSPECVRSRTNYWDECWEKECKRIVSDEFGCALDDSKRCTSPFSSTLLQVRHPLRTVATLLASFCPGDDAAGAAKSIQLETLGIMFPTCALAYSSLDKGACTVGFGWYWVEYNRAMIAAGLQWYRVEDTPKCEILRKAHSFGSSSTVPEHIRKKVASRCADQKREGIKVANSHKEGHGNINRRNVGSRRITRSLADVRALDEMLASEMRSVASKLGYGDIADYVWPM